MIRHDVPRASEPEIRDLLQDPALVWDGIRHHYIEGGYPVRGHDEHRVRVHGVDVPYLALVDFFQSIQSSTEDSWRLHGVRHFGANRAASRHLVL